MKKMWFLVLSVGCLQAMNRSVVHSADPGVPLCDYWQPIVNLDCSLIPDLDVVRVFLFLRGLVQVKPVLLSWTPRTIARQYFAELYPLIHNGYMVSPDKQVVEETGGTVEGMLRYLNKLAKRNYGQR